MSDIERFVTIWGGGGMMPAINGNYVRYDDHRAEVERLTARQTEMETHITGLTTELHRTRADGIELRWVADEVEQLTAQRDAAQAEMGRLKEQVAALTVAVEQADEMKANAEAAAAAEEAQTDRVMSERDAAQAEVERLRANGQGPFDSSRPSDEDIWREAFMAAIEGGRVYDRMTVADLALADYRKRWPL